MSSKNVTETLLSKGDDSSIAILARNEFVTYKELREKVNGLASGLLTRGYRKGERIGIVSENSPFFVIAYLATIRAGLVTVPLQVELSAEGVDQIASEAGLKAVFVSRRFVTRHRPWSERRGVPILVESAIEALLVDSAAPIPEIDPRRDLAALMFTSGSTGEPKGVMVSHRNIECNASDIVSYLGLSAADRAMVVLPFHYCFGASLLHTHLMAGGSVVLNNDFKLYPESVLQEMQQKECTGLAGVPSTYQILLKKSRFQEISFPRLRWFQQAGGKLPNSCIRQILTSFTQVRFFLMYGQTEGAARLSYLPPERLADKLGSIGKGLPSTKLEVLKADGTAVVPGAEEIGEVVASGDNITLGYWNDGKETAKYFRSGKLYTGDLARVDSEGFIFIVERERDMIKSGGHRVSAKEIEEVIAEMPEVVEAAVVGAPHELLGEAITAYVVPAPGALIQPENVLGHCRERLPMFKMPKEVVFLPALPHNDSGKIAKVQLRAILQAHSPETGEEPRALPQIASTENP